MNFYFDSTLLILIPAFLFAMFAQYKISATYKKYSQVYGSQGYTGAQIARFILDQNGLQTVAIEPISGELTDHYDPSSKVVRLSQGVFRSNSLAAVGVAAHECGHAVQHSTGYAPLKLRNAIIPITNIGSKIAVPILLVGMLFSIPILMWIGIFGYALMAIFQLITLPVEFNASNRALKIIKENNLLVDEENSGAKKVLNAAAMTYVAALMSSLATLLRLITLTQRRNRN